MVKVPKVVSHIQNIISENLGTLLTGKVIWDIFARVEGKSAIFGRDMQASFEELKIELRTEVGDVRTDLKGGATGATNFGTKSSPPKSANPQCAHPRPLFATGTPHDKQH